MSLPYGKHRTNTALGLLTKSYVGRSSRIYKMILQDALLCDILNLQKAIYGW